MVPHGATQVGISSQQCVICFAAYFLSTFLLGKHTNNSELMCSILSPKASRCRLNWTTLFAVRGLTVDREDVTGDPMLSQAASMYLRRFWRWKAFMCSSSLPGTGRRTADCLFLTSTWSSCIHRIVSINALHADAAYVKHDHPVQTKFWLINWRPWVQNYHSIHQHANAWVWSAKAE